MPTLLKIGRLDLITNQREKALLSHFDEIIIFTYPYDKNKHAHVLRTFKKEYKKRIKVIEFDISNNKANAYLKKLVDANKTKSRQTLLMKLLILLARIVNYKVIKQIKQYQFKYIHSSFSDWDCSDFLTILLRPYVQGELVRIYKESRPGFNWCEKRCFEMSDRILLMDSLNYTFFERKYGNGFFKNKHVEFGYDENILSRDVINHIIHRPKLSEKDHKRHFVILSGRVMCDSSDARSGGRLYYIPIIQELINSGFVVHLHTLSIEVSQNGINSYELLQQKYPTAFYIAEPLDMINSPIESLELLSQYDFGILHNFKKGASVSKFDQTNVANRFYEYEAAHVIPIVLSKTARLMEKLFREHQCGLIVREYSECQNFDTSQIKWYTPDYESYIERIYSNRDEVIE